MSVPLDIQIVRRARDLIADRAHWCQGFGALAADGRIANPRSGDAASFCALGALDRAAMDLGLDYCDVQGFAKAMTGSGDLQVLFDINDSRNGHARVLAMFDRYIAEARA
jgi:hypothetical protein